MNKNTALLMISFLSISITAFSNPLTSLIGKTAAKSIAKKEATQITKQLVKTGTQTALKATAKESVKFAAKEAVKKGTTEIFVENLPKIIISTGVGVGAYEIAHNTTQPALAISRQIEEGKIDGEKITSHFIDKTSETITNTTKQPLLVLTLIIGLVYFLRFVNFKHIAESIKSILSQKKEHTTLNKASGDNNVEEAVIVSK